MNDDIASQRYQDYQICRKKYFENVGMAFSLAGHIIMQ